MEILSKKSRDWDYEFCDRVYDEVQKRNYFITNLGKCTQIDARPIEDEILTKYLDLLFKEISIIKPKIIITFGNQVSSIILNEKISVSMMRKSILKKKLMVKYIKFFRYFILLEMVYLILINPLKI